MTKVTTVRIDDEVIGASHRVHFIIDGLERLTAGDPVSIAPARRVGMAP